MRVAGSRLAGEEAQLHEVARGERRLSGHSPGETRRRPDVDVARLPCDVGAPARGAWARGARARRRSAARPSTAGSRSCTRDTGGTSADARGTPPAEAALRRRAARLRSLSSVEASLGPAADARACGTGGRSPQRGRALPADALPRERREGSARRGGEARAARQRAALRGGARPVAWFPILFAHAVHELRTAPRYARRRSDAECAADPCDWRHCSKAARKAAADKEATPAVTARRFRAWVRELVSGRRPASHLCERPGGSWLGLQTDWLDVAAADFGVDCLVPLEELGEFWALLSANLDLGGPVELPRLNNVGSGGGGGDVDGLYDCATARLIATHAADDFRARGVADASEAAVTRSSATAGLKRRASCAPLERACPRRGGARARNRRDAADLFGRQGVARVGAPLDPPLCVPADLLAHGRVPGGRGRQLHVAPPLRLPVGLLVRASTTDGAFAARAQLAKADRTSAKAWLPRPSGLRRADLRQARLRRIRARRHRRRHLLRFRHRAPPPAPRVRRARPRDAGGRSTPYRHVREYAGRMAETAWRESTSRVLGAPLNQLSCIARGRRTRRASAPACARPSRPSTARPPSWRMRSMRTPTAAARRTRSLN